MSFIGELEVVTKEPVEGKEGFIKVTFDTEHVTEMQEELFNILETEEKGQGNVTDNIRDFFARKFLAELSQFHLGFYFANSIGVAMETLAHNLREQLIQKTFNCTGGNDISLKLLLDKIVVEDTEE